MCIPAKIDAADIQAYPGGYPAWHAAVSAAATRQGAHPVKSPVLGGGKHENRGKYGLAPKNAAIGQKSGKTAHVRGEPNVTESRYRDEFLIPRILSGEIVECVFEGMTFELAHRCSYTPDWWVTLADGSHEAHEVKGPHVWDDARVKAKVAARMNATIRFYWCQWKGEKWRIKQIPA